MFKIINGLTPSYLSDMFTRTSSLSGYGLRSSRMNIELPKNKTNYFKNSFAFTGAKLWNNLPNSLKEEKSLDRFKSEQKLFSLSASTNCPNSSLFLDQCKSSLFDFSSIETVNFCWLANHSKI